jgi:glycosyltransferase involved in cell wall biosynthesis
MLGSHHESAGYALIEALACGATPIVSDIPSFRRLTGGGSIGALAPVGDAAAFARALVDLAARPRAVLRRQAVEHFARDLPFDAVGARLLEIYAALVRGAA